MNVFLDLGEIVLSITHFRCSVGVAEDTEEFRGLCPAAGEFRGTGCY